MADNLRACLVIAAGVLIHTTIGTLSTFGNLSPYITSYMRQRGSPSDLTYGQSVWIMALNRVGQGTTMFFGGLLEDRIGPRLTVLCGGWFMSLGVALTYFSLQHSFAATALTYGLMFGCGIGVAYAVPIAMGMRWFPHRRGLVSGFVVAGFGVGASVFNQIQTAYVNPDNLSPDQTVNGENFFTQSDILDRVPRLFLLLASCYAVLQLIGVILLVTEETIPIIAKEEACERIPAEVKDSSPPKEIEVSPKGLFKDRTFYILWFIFLLNGHGVQFVSSLYKTVHILLRSPPKEIEVSPKGLFKDRTFYILWFIFLLNGHGVQFVSSLYKVYGQTFISDDVFLAWVGAFATVFNAGGGPMWGSLADRYSFKVAMTCMCCMFFVLILTLGVTALAGRWMFLVWVCLLFLAFSGNFSLIPIACVKSFGQKHCTKNYGLMFTSQVITSPISAVLISQLLSAIGWNGMFYMTAAFTLISFILSVAFQKKMPDGTDV